MGSGPIKDLVTTDVNMAWRRLSKAAAGDEARQRELNMARDEALKEIKNHE